jgi:hypothetical protein
MNEAWYCSASRRVLVLKASAVIQSCYTTAPMQRTDHCSNTSDTRCWPLRLRHSPQDGRALTVTLLTVTDSYNSDGFTADSLYMHTYTNPCCVRFVLLARAGRWFLHP